MPPNTSATPWTAIPASRRFLAGLALAMSNFMVVLDLTIANVSVPHIAGSLGITLDQGTWIITSYAVAEAICVPLTGWLAQRFGTVRVFLISMFGFGLFSMLCGLSVSLSMIVLCRIGQGLCGGPIMPMSQTLMMRVFPPESRPMAMGIWAMTVILGPALGPILGGVISDQISWHWVFLINVPIAALCIGAAWLLLRPVETETLSVPIDRVGLLLLMFWIGCLQLMLDIGRDHDWFGDWKIVALAIMAAVGFLVFMIWELTEDHPIVDLRTFRHRGFSTTVATLSLTYGAFSAALIMVPQWLQATLGYTATKAGIITAMHAFSAAMVAPFVARLMPKYDARLLIFGGIGWMTITSYIRAHWASDVDFFGLAWPMFIQGFGVPFMIMPLTAASLASVPADETASAAGLQNFVRTMSMAVATSLVLTIWGDAQRTSRVEIVGSMHGDAAQATLASAGMDQQQSAAVLSGLVDREAVTLAVDHTFLVTAMVFALAAAVVWLTPRVRTSGASTAAH